MHTIDYIIFVVLHDCNVRLFHFFKKNKTAEDFYVSGRNMSSWHIGLSVVATDVGGGFSIGLGGLGFTMGFLVHGCYSRDLRLVECRLLFQRLAILDTNINFSLFHKSSVISMTDGLRF
jgi:Na+/pantothenate symporter